MINCIHHWFIESDKSLSMTEEEESSHPNCLARKAECTKCGKEDRIYERIYGTTFVITNERDELDLNDFYWD